MKTSYKKHDIRILQELEDLIPPLKKDEFKQLEENILEYGCREELLVWPSENGELLLVDGHNRLKICTKHKLNFRMKEISFPSLEEAKDFMIINQLGRRNLSPQQASYLRGLRFSREKNEKGKHSRDDGGQAGKTAAKLAKEYQVSQATIERDGTFLEGIQAIGKNNPELKKAILKGEIRLKKGMIRKAGKISNIPRLSGRDELVDLLSDTQQNSKHNTNREDQLRAREEAKHKLLELCIAMEGTTFVSKVMAKNILHAAQELHDSF
jgi:ParB-like chromosome segregation protein Spo0J